jgi:BASS family bile acid:Na+ symporter
MGMGLAVDVLHSAKAAVAPVIFGKWMNISGSALANYWRQKPLRDGEIE